MRSLSTKTSPRWRPPGSISAALTSAASTFPLQLHRT